MSDGRRSAAGLPRARLLREMGLTPQWRLREALAAGRQRLAESANPAKATAGRRAVEEDLPGRPVGLSVTLASTLLSLPTLGMYYGLHEWTAAQTGGIVDARFIALIDTALESPLGQIAMVPMLAWIANSAPAKLKATYLAVMASFTNLALSASQLGTRYLNQIFEVNREVRDPLTNALTSPADYSQLGALFIVSIVVGLVLPFAAIWLTRILKLRSA